MRDLFQPLQLLASKGLLQKLLHHSLIGSVAVLSFSCTQTEAPDASLELQVEPGGRAGLYTASGTTNLPDQSRLIVMAIRPLQKPKKSALTSASSVDTNYAILERQAVEVKQGKWQTNLNLWQVAPNGQYQEVWQLNQSKLGVSFSPGSEVTFLATFDPAAQPPKIQEQLQQQAIKLEGQSIRFTGDGERYLQASQALPVKLPTGKTTPPPVPVSDQNDGWGDRSRPLPDADDKQVKPSVSSNLSQTDAPLSLDQRMR